MGARRRVGMVVIGAALLCCVEGLAVGQYPEPPPVAPPPGPYGSPPGAPAMGPYGPPLPGPGWQGPPLAGPEMFAPPPFAGAPPTFEGAPPPELVEPVLPPPDDLLEPEYGWLLGPGSWFPKEGWSNSFEVGLNGSTGNAETFSLRTGAHLERKADPSTLILDVKYARTLADAALTQHNALLNSNVETNLGDSPWNTFFKSSLEYDEFKAFDVRTAMNLGVGYRLIASEQANFSVRFGSGVSRELGGPDDRYVPEAVYGLSFDRRITNRQKLYATVDYFPDWSDYHDFRLVTDAGWEFLLDDLDNLSLKLGAIDRYDSTPHGREPNDLDYSLLLIWKR